MSEEKPVFRFISPQPRLAMLLRQMREERPSTLVDDAFAEWALRWLEDVGVIMRSRDFMAYMAAMYGSIGLMSTFLRRLPDVALLDTFLKRLGFVE